jgi:hypothetical protein
MDTFPFNVPHQSASWGGDTQPRPDEVRDTTGSRQFLRQHQIPQLNFSTGIDVNPGPVAALHTYVDHPILEGLSSWNPGSRRTSLSKHSFHPWAEMDAHNPTGLVNLDKTGHKEDDWCETFEQPSSTDLLSTTGLNGVQLQPESDSIQHSATSPNPELGNLHLCLDSFLDVEDILRGMNELHGGYCFQENVIPDSMLAHVHSSNPFHIECKL